MGLSLLDLNASSSIDVIDFRLLKCPLLLVKIKQHVKHCRKGTTLRFWVSDPSLRTDLERLAKGGQFTLSIITNVESMPNATGSNINTESMTNDSKQVDSCGVAYGKCGLSF